MLSKVFDRALPFLISATIIFSPLYVVRCRSFTWCVSPVPFTLLEVLVVLTLLVWLSEKILSRKSFYLKENLQKIPFFLLIFFVIFIASAFVGVLVSGQKIAALGIFKAFFLEPILFSYVCLDYLRKRRANTLIIVSLALAALWLSILVIFQYFFHYSPANLNEYLLRGRVGGVYSTSNAVALFLGPILFVILGKMFDLIPVKTFHNQTLLVYLLLTAIIGSAAGILLSGSRGGIFGLFFGLVIFLLLKLIKEKNNQKLLKNIKKFTKYAVPIAFFIISLLLFNLGFLSNIIQKNNFFPDIIPRVCLWEGSANLIKQNLIFGVGISNFLEAYPSFRTCSQEIISYPHNLIFNFWTEIGIVGLISFLGINVILLVKLLENTSFNLTKIGVICSLLVIFVHGMVDVPYFKNDLSLIFWVIVALSLSEIDHQSFIVRHRNLPPTPRR